MCHYKKLLTTHSRVAGRLGEKGVRIEWLTCSLVARSPVNTNLVSNSLEGKSSWKGKNRNDFSRPAAIQPSCPRLSRGSLFV